MKEKILQVLDASEEPLSVSKIESRLSIRTAKQFSLMIKALNKLETEGRIERIDERYYRLKDEPKVPSAEGVLRMTKAGNGFLDLENESVFIPFGSTGDAMDGDTVRVGFYYGTPVVDEVLVRAHTYISGTLCKKRKSLVLRPDDPKIPEDIHIVNASAFMKNEGLKASVKILSYKYPMEGKIERILGKPEELKTEVYAILADHEVFPEYPADALEEAAAIPYEIPEEEYRGRTDLTGIPHITIDGDDAKDFDDAVALIKEDNGHTRLYVSIADVAHYVPFGKPIDNEAYRRGTSVYAADMAVPMLPEKLSADICSLRPGVTRLTVTAEMETDAEGNVLQSSVYPSYIRSAKRMTYRKTNLLLENEEKTLAEYKELAPMIFAMRDLSVKVREKRTENGAIDFAVPEPEFEINEAGDVLSVSPRKRGEAEMLIEDFMILANTTVAHLLIEKKIPGIYRVHDKPSKKRMTDLVHLLSVFGYKWKGGTDVLVPKQFADLLASAKDDPSFPVIAAMTLRTMAKAKYSDECAGHFGLALEEYVHFTSPIRRYPDLFVHRMLHKYLFENRRKGENNDRIFAEKAADQSSLKERGAQEAEFAVNDYLFAKYMSHHIGEEFTGTISHVSGRGLFVRLPDTVEGLVPVESMADDYYTFSPSHYSLIGNETGKTYSIGEEVSVRCMSADPYEPSVRFALISNKARRKESQNAQRKRRSKDYRR